MPIQLKLTYSNSSELLFWRREPPKGHENTVALLCEKGIDIDLFKLGEMTILCPALDEGYTGASPLVRAGAEVDEFWWNA